MSRENTPEQSSEQVYAVKLTRVEARALRLAVIFGAPSDPEPQDITTAMAKLHAVEKRAKKQERSS